MAATPYIVLAPDMDSDPARSLINGIDGMVVMAGSSNDAKAMAKSRFEQDTDVIWSNATASAIAADTSVHGWTLDINIAGVGDVSVVADGVVNPGVKATGSVNSTTGAPSDGDQFDIGGTTYTFKTVLGATAHNVLIGGSAVNAIAHLVQAITFDGGAGTNAGTNYVGAAADTHVTAVVDATTTKADITALAYGTAGNSLVLTAPTNVSTNLAVSGGTLTGGVDGDSVDSLGVAMAAALNAAGIGIAHAAYVTSTHTLTVAGTADNLGDKTFVARMLPANRVRDVSIDAFFGTHTDGGSAGSALTLVLSAAHTIPLTAAGMRIIPNTLVPGAVVTASPCIVTLNADGALGYSLRNNVDTAVLYAASATDAKAYAQAMYAETMPAPWGAATPALIAAAADLTGWKIRVQIVNLVPGSAYSSGTTYAFGDLAVVGGVSYVNINQKGSTGVSPPDTEFWAPAPSVTVVDQTYTGVGSDTVDLVGAALVTALNADPSTLVANASYDSSTNILTAAGTADNLGDHQLLVTWVPPGANETISIPGFVGAIVDEGSAGDALTVAFAADSYCIPQVCAQLRRR